MQPIQKKAVFQKMAFEAVWTHMSNRTAWELSVVTKFSDVMSAGSNSERVQIFDALGQFSN